jgi:N-acetylmuramoyl-L-alanine amidase
VPSVALGCAALLAACSASHPAADHPSGGGSRSVPATSASAPRSPSPSPALPLAGRTIVIDPGHNGGNAADPAFINRLVPAGGFSKPCDAVGTETASGYPEYAFTLDVAERAAALLRREGARVILTRTTSTGVGPCVNARAAAGNDAHANAAISIHADGAAASGSGFHVIAPLLAPDGANAAVLGPSGRLALDVRSAFSQSTGEPFANYVAQQGLIARNDLGGLNLSRVPKVFIECANMRNASDAARVQDPSWRQRAAAGIAAGLSRFLS